MKKRSKIITKGIKAGFMQPPKRGGGFKTHAMRVVTSSKKHKWRTDPRLISLIEEFSKDASGAMRGIGLDPCASKLEKHHFAETNYSLHNGKDGLVEFWTGHGVTYANPEYQRSTLIKFIRKAVDEFVDGVERDKRGRPVSRTDDDVRLRHRGADDDHLFLLVPARPDTKWFQMELLPYATALCFWKGRLKFSGKDPAPFPSLVLYFGKKPKRFRRLFGAHGWVPTIL